MAIQIDTVQQPFAGHDTGRAAALLLARADVLGVVPSDPPSQRLDIALMNAVLGALRSHGLPGRAVVATTRAAWLQALREANAALEVSPLPSLEWPALRSVLGDELLARLCGVSEMSIRRYAAGQRRTPDDVAQRLHALALVIADLRGAYNDYGVRRWFDRPRVQLGGDSPATALGRDWDPDDAAAARVRALAASLTASPVT